MIERTITSVQEKVWALYQAVKIEVAQLETGDVFELRSRAEQLKSSEACSRRMASEIISASCASVLETRGQNGGEKSGTIPPLEQSER